MTGPFYTDFNYTPEQWAKIAREIPEGWNHVEMRTNLERFASAYLSLQAEHKSDVTAASSEQSWVRVATAAVELRDALLEAHASASYSFLSALRHLIANADQNRKRAKITEKVRKATPIFGRKFLVVQVIVAWCSQGGQLKYSRVKNAVTGPLPRFVHAATEPVLGESVLSPERIADVIKEYREHGTVSLFPRMG